MKRAFTLIELVAAIAVLAIIASFAGTIFSVSIDSHRVSAAQAEIMQKLRAITDQLNADFKGLRKDGEIFVVWSAVPVDEDHLVDFEAYSDDPDQHVRFDRIMFFANGDFHTYHQRDGDIRGNVARISYMLASNLPDDPADPVVPARLLPRERRILARTQHILTSDPMLPRDFPDLAAMAAMSVSNWYDWHNLYEYDKTTLEKWKQIPRGPPGKADMLTVVTHVLITGANAKHRIGAIVEPSDSNSLHMLLCEGVGEFMIQGWHDELQRWVPEVEVDTNGDGIPDDTDFFASGPGDIEPVPGVLYPGPYGDIRDYGDVRLGGPFVEGGPYYFDPRQLDEEHFNQIPGLGRALKFTFTLYDSRGIIERGRTFTHIVYLDD
jgi:prepilin-type N-terminal cleavage/methylation domain-containing protein